MTHAADICVVVPGLGGSTLVKDGKVVWDVSNAAFVRAMLTRGLPFERLSLDDPERDDGVVASRITPGLTFIPGVWHYGDIRPLRRVLHADFGADGVAEFPYDWRRSIGWSATLLAKHVDRLLARRPPGARVVLVGHSMGGLVARRYLALEGGAERCSLLVTVGTPYRGALKALDVLAHGVRRVPGRTGERLRTLLRSLPSVHELLPTYDCFVERDDSLSGLSDRVPADIEPVPCRAAAALHDETARSVAALGAGMPQTLAVVAQHQRTATFARWRGDADFTVVRRGDASLDAVRRSKGDGTVARGSAQPPEWGDDATRAHVVDGRHVDLPAGTSMHKTFRAVRQGRVYLGLGPEAETGLEVELPDVVRCSEPVTVRAGHSDDRLVLDLWVTDVHDATPVAHLALANLGDGQYRQVLHGLPSGQYQVAVTGIVDGRPQRISDLVVVLPDHVS